MRQIALALPGEEDLLEDTLASLSISDVLLSALRTSLATPGR